MQRQQSYCTSNLFCFTLQTLPTPTGLFHSCAVNPLQLPSPAFFMSSISVQALLNIPLFHMLLLSNLSLFDSSESPMTYSCWWIFPVYSLICLFPTVSSCRMWPFGPRVTTGLSHGPAGVTRPGAMTPWLQDGSRSARRSLLALFTRLLQTCSSRLTLWSFNRQTVTLRQLDIRLMCIWCLQGSFMPGSALRKLSEHAKEKKEKKGCKQQKQTWAETECEKVLFSARRIAEIRKNDEHIKF